MKRIVAVAGVLCATIVSMTFAQKKSLTLEESLTIGLESSKVLHASQMRSEYAEAKAREVSASLYPSLKVQASYQRLSSVPEFKIPFPGIPTIFPYIADNYVARASFQQPLFTGWKLQGAADNASYQAEATRRDVVKDKGELVFNIKSAYWNLFRAREIKRLADENVAQVSAHLKDTENLIKQGLVTANDLLKVKIQLSNSRILQSDAVNNVQLATIVFNSTVGLPLQTEIEITSPLTPTSKEFGELEKLQAVAFIHRPEILAMESRIKASDAAIVSATGGWFPQVFLTGNYYYSRPNQRIIPLQDAFNDTWDVGVSIQFDLWNSLSTVHQTSQARSQHEQNKDLLVTLKDGVTLEVTQNYLNYQQSKERIRLSELTVQQANENYRMTSEKFKAGLATSSELLDAEVALLQSKLQLTQALVDHELSEARLTKSVGDLK
ncbi:MAG: TolC family protein [Ignavibacteriales bacterium]|nr:TolC family protein [Ignavibacteriales bacterium]